MKPHFLSRCGMALVSAAALFTAHVQAQPTIYSDPIGDISTNTGTGSGTLDIIKMEVSDSATDVIFNLTVNGNIASTDWGKFMIGIASMKAAGATNATGNGWGRPINMIASPTNGMTHWIGSWVNEGGEAQLWTYTGSSWSDATTLASHVFLANTNGTSTLTYIVTKASLGVTNGDTISFDAYSSGGGITDSAVDALSNPNISINGWSGPYTSSAATGISTYTLSNSAITDTQTITFSVDMNVQIATGGFYPEYNDEVFVEWGPSNGIRAYLTDEDNDGVYTGSAEVTSASGLPVNYRYGIEAEGYDYPEAVSRSFSMPNAPLVLGTVFFNNLEGLRNVTFTVNMSVQEALGAFDPNTQNVKVAGSFNGWNTGNSNSPLVDQGNGIYSGTVLLSKFTGEGFQYKFYKTGLGDAGYEDIDNRTAEVVLNVGGAANPAQVLPSVFFNNLDAVPSTRNVTFSVDMSVQVNLGNFPPTGGMVSVVGGFNSWSAGSGVLTNNGSNVFSGTFAVSGNQGSSTEYKFYSTNIGAGDNAYETIGNRALVLGAPDVAQVVPTAFWNNNPGGTTFSAWSSGQQPTSALVAQYAVGGATSPTAGNGIPSASSLTGGTLTLVAIVRTDDPKLTVTGVTTTDLSGGVWTDTGVTATDAPDQTGVPSGCTRKIFSVAQDGPRRFLAIHATLAP